MDKQSAVLTYKPGVEAPGIQLPSGACDAHVHVFGPGNQFAYSESRNFTPVDAPKEALFALHHKLGISRCVIVQSLVHGFDNRVVEDAIAAGGGRYLGVALVPVSVGDLELARLARAGIRGVRFNFMKHLGASNDVAAIVGLTSRLAEHGMHLQVHFESSLIHELAGPLSQSAVPLVIDHMARVNARLGVEQPEVKVLERLLGNSQFHVKISGIDRVDSKSFAQTPAYTAGIALAHHLLKEFPAQCLWGTDWPHPNHTHVPNDATLVNALAHIAPSDAALLALMVDNPQALYQFET